jgi:hypothetical protein
MVIFHHSILWVAEALEDFTVLQVVFILFVSCMIVFDFELIFNLDPSFLDWKPGCRGGCFTSGGRGGGCFTSGGRGAGHRIYDTRWPESETCNVI